MGIEGHSEVADERRKERERGKIVKILALLLSILLLVVGAVGAPLLTRIYFLHGGTRIWVTTIVQFAAFPLILPFIYGSYVHRSHHGDRRLVLISPKVMAASIGLGIISAIDAYLYGYGSMSLPLSTSTLLIATQIVFTALFAFILVRHKFTAFSVNAIILLVIGSVLLGVQSSSDRPPGESKKRYYLGFFAMIGAAVLYGLLMPLIEWIYKRFKQKATISAILEMQIIMSVTGSAVSVVAMAINHDFASVSREAEMYELGKTKYYFVLWGAGIFWQFMTLGFLGVIACSSALLSGVIVAMLLPVGEIMPVLLLGEKFTSAKGIATAICLWGFISYLYGDYMKNDKKPVAPPDDGSVELTAAPGILLPFEATP